ncbi:hypothetical protein [uncultured Anaerovibrio sp.]|uniref:hypothetical protein n=1 Tax=uncultured Anaerovibrio sp. TaxID=361586 RepID=UPI00260F3180|nr:hypothetical protein [uncultured Anaerovibrio sp.]
MYAETRNDWMDNGALHSEVMRPLEERLADTKPELVEPLQKTREMVGQEVYDRAFKTVETFNRAGDTLLIVVGNPRERSFLERDCIDALKNAFGVKKVRIVC